MSKKRLREEIGDVAFAFSLCESNVTAFCTLCSLV